MKKTALIFTLSSIAASVAYANNPPPPPPGGNPPLLPAFERDPAQTAVSTQPSINPNELKEDLLRQQKLSAKDGKASSAPMIKYTGRELMNNPAVLEEMFLAALIYSNKSVCRFILNCTNKCRIMINL